MGKSRNILSWCLFPITMWYAIGVWFRNRMFDLSILRSESANATTISVGNLACGGTGKTPHVEYLIALLGNTYSTALLSRGYKRQTKGFVLADDEHRNSHALGDEPAMIANKHTNITVAVCEKRVEGANKLLELENPPQLILLDDAFQHRYIKPNINILLTEYGHPYYNDHVIPFGNLRESRKENSRADIIVVTKTPKLLNSIERYNIQLNLKPKPYQKVFFSYLDYGDITPLLGGRILELKGIERIVLVTGIVHPEPLVAHLSGRCRVKHLCFPDHHDFTAEDIGKIKQAFDSLNGEKKIILTTEKDAARIMHQIEQNSNEWKDLPLYYIPVEVKFHSNHDYNFDEVICSKVKENISFKKFQNTLTPPIP